MIRSRWAKHVRRTAFCGALGLVMLAVCAQGSARAEDDDDSDSKNSIWNLDQRIFGDVLRGLGLRNGSENEIDYRERSPLVLPPSRNLPAPEAKPQTDAAWPVDPELKRKREAAAKRGNRKDATYDFNASRPLTPSELNPPGATAGSGPTGTPGSVDSSGRPLKPSELGYFGGMFSWQGFGFGGQKDEVGTFSNEPPRTSLTAPPVGYQTPSVAQPYGVSKKLNDGKPLMKTEDIPVGR